MTVINIKDKVKNNKLNLSGLGLTEIPAKEIVSVAHNILYSSASVTIVVGDRYSQVFSLWKLT